MINTAHSVDIYTEAKFGNCLIELEVMVPKGANSGIYLMGNYEVQVLDSFGKKQVDAGDMGAVYGQDGAEGQCLEGPRPMAEVRYRLPRPEV